MKSEIILLGHGSRRKEANEGLLEVAKKVSRILGKEVTPAFMGHESPNLPNSVLKKIEEGANRVVIMPLFLFPGMHVTVDIHEEVQEIIAKHPDVEIVFTKELGADETIANLAGERIKEVLGA